MKRDDRWTSKSTDRCQIFLFQSCGRVAAALQGSHHKLKPFSAVSLGNLSKKTWTVSVSKRPQEGQLFYAAHSKHNVVLPTASLGVSCTVRNEAALDPRRFHRSPLFIFAASHISTNIWALLSLFRKPDTVKQKNAFPPNFIHSLDSTHMMMTALGCYRYRCCKCLFISVLSWISAPTLFSCLPSALLFFTVPAWRTFLCTTASGRTLSLWTPWTRYHFPVWPWFIPVCPVCPCPRCSARLSAFEAVWPCIEFFI